MSRTKSNVLGRLNPKQFLRDYWQKKPLFIPQALPGFHSPLSPAELAGLACEEGVEARIVVHKGGNRWEVRYGPFAPGDFRSLPDTRWTVLVQGVERYHAGISALLSCFNFIPKWRIDDVMISYAAPGGGVGPHYDSYDVFLLQGYGRRRWQINTGAVSDQHLIPGLDLRILKKFRAQQQWLMEPGDLLYLPPGIAHHGSALEPCMTLSIGLLAPTRSELVTGFMDEVIARTPCDARFADANRKPQRYAGEISAGDYRRLTRMMRAALSGDEQLRQWLGKYLTRGHDDPRRSGGRKLSFREFHEKFRARKIIYRRYAARTAFIRNNRGLLLFINGECVPLPRKFLKLAVLITDQSAIRYSDLDAAPAPTALKVLHGLYNDGHYRFSRKAAA